MPHVQFGDELPQAGAETLRFDAGDDDGQIRRCTGDQDDALVTVLNFIQLLVFVPLPIGITHEIADGGQHAAHQVGIGGLRLLQVAVRHQQAGFAVNQEDFAHTRTAAPDLAPG